VKRPKQTSFTQQKNSRLHHNPSSIFFCLKSPEDVLNFAGGKKIIIWPPQETTPFHPNDLQTPVRATRCYNCSTRGEGKVNQHSSPKPCYLLRLPPKSPISKSASESQAIWSRQLRKSRHQDRWGGGTPVRAPLRFEQNNSPPFPRYRLPSLAPYHVKPTPTEVAKVVQLPS